MPRGKEIDLSRAYFEFKGRNSKEFGIRIANELQFAVPAKDMEEVEVMGRDGVLYIDNNRRKPFTKNIRITVDVNDPRAKGSEGSVLHERVREISDWLTGTGEWRWGMYSGYVWTATIKDTFNIDDTLRRMGRGVIQVTFHPTMMLDNQAESELENNDVLVNTTNELAKPLITVEGTGDMDFYNNDEPWFSLENITGKIVLDSELMEVSDEDDKPAYDNIYSNIRPLFPELVSGENKISWEGSGIEKVTILPRWVVEAT